MIESLVGPASAFALALLASLSFTPAVRRLALWAGWVDRPDGIRKLQSTPTPLAGGGAICLAVVVALAVISAGNWQPARGAWPWLTAAGLAGCVGFLDDLCGLRVRWKLLGQLVAAAPLLATDVVVRRIDVAGITLELGWIAVPFTLGWLLAGINAFNFLDGMDGFAATIGAAAMTALGLALAVAHPSPALACAALAGALAGFLRFNRAPASIYLGDAGSLMVGMAWASMAIGVATAPAESGESAGVVRLGALVAWMALPLADLVLAIVRRLARGKCFWIGDRGHVHHQMAEQGISPRQIAVRGAAATIALAVAGGLAMSVHDLAGWGVLAAAAILAVRFRWAGQVEWRLTYVVIRHTLRNVLRRKELAGQPTIGPAIYAWEHPHPSSARKAA